VASIDAGNNATTALRPWALLGLLVVVAQIVLGAVTSANFAGPSCTVLPGCNGNWASIANLVQGFDLFNTLGADDQGRIITGSMQETVHMTHRLGAIVTFVYLAWLAVKALKLDNSLHNAAISIIVFLIIQAGLGISAVLTELPLLLVTAHNAIATMLLLAVVNLNHLLTPTRNPAQP